MTKDNLTGLLMIACIAGITGLVMLFGSVYFGGALAESWLAGRGGADTAAYLLVMESHIRNFCAAGGILFGFSLVMTAVVYVKFQQLDSRMQG